MINKDRSRALIAIEAEEAQPEQAVEGISLAFLHAHFQSISDKIQQDT